MRPGVTRHPAAFIALFEGGGAPVPTAETIPLVMETQPLGSSRRWLSSVARSLAE